MSYVDEMNLAIGRLQASVSMGFREVHRRMDDRDRFTTERHHETMWHIHRLDRRLDKRSNGGGMAGIPYAKIAAFLGLLILGTLGHVAPEALRAGIKQMIPAVVKQLLNQLASG